MYEPRPIADIVPQDFDRFDIVSNLRTAVWGAGLVTAVCVGVATAPLADRLKNVLSNLAQGTNNG